MQKKYLFSLLLIILLCRPPAESYAEIIKSQFNKNGKYTVFYNAQDELKIQDILNFIYLTTMNKQLPPLNHLHFSCIVWDCEAFVRHYHSSLPPGSKRAGMIRECNELVTDTRTVVSELEETFVQHSRIQNNIRQFQKEQTMQSNENLEIQRQLQYAENAITHLDSLLKALKKLKKYDKKVILTIRNLFDQVKNNPEDMHSENKIAVQLFEFNQSQRKTIKQIVSALRVLYNKKISPTIAGFLNVYSENFDHATSNNNAPNNKVVDSLIQATGRLKNSLNLHLVPLRDSHTNMLQKIQITRIQINMKVSQLKGLWTNFFNQRPEEGYFDLVLSSIPPMDFSFDLEPVTTKN